MFKHSFPHRRLAISSHAYAVMYTYTAQNMTLLPRLFSILHLPHEKAKRAVCQRISQIPSQRYIPCLHVPEHCPRSFQFPRRTCQDQKMSALLPVETLTEPNSILPNTFPMVAVQKNQNPQAIRHLQVADGDDVMCWFNVPFPKRNRNIGYHVLNNS